MVLGDDGTLLDAAAGRFHGLVVAGFGGGHVPGPIAAALGDAAQRIPIVLASRTGAGMVLAGTYAYPGSELYLRGRPARPGPAGLNRPPVTRTAAGAPRPRPCPGPGRRRGRSARPARCRPGTCTAPWSPTGPG